MFFQDWGNKGRWGRVRREEGERKRRTRAEEEEEEGAYTVGEERGGGERGRREGGERKRRTRTEEEEGVYTVVNDCGSEGRIILSIATLHFLHDGHHTIPQLHRKTKQP